MTEESRLEKIPYRKPFLIRLGSVKELTRGAGGTLLDGACGRNQRPGKAECQFE